MAKINKDLYALTVILQIGHGREISKLEKILAKYGDIQSEYSMRAPRDGRRPIVNMVYLVTTEDPARLKNSLSNNLRNMKSETLFIL